ncbi:transposable element Tcb2 transposase [Trichonephila clavipes]|nr:transposable element Tcb2 transposase [Trichonephila clavipes]
MVWGVIAYNTRSPLLLIRGTMTNLSGMSMTSTTTCVATNATAPGSSLQQDSARLHTSSVSQDCLHTVAPFLGLPDAQICLFLIERIWDHLRRQVWHPTNLNELETRNEMYQYII